MARSPGATSPHEIVVSLSAIRPQAHRTVRGGLVGGRAVGLPDDAPTNGPRLLQECVNPPCDELPGRGLPRHGPCGKSSERLKGMLTQTPPCTRRENHPGGQTDSSTPLSTMISNDPIAFRQRGPCGHLPRALAALTTWSCHEPHGDPPRARLGTHQTSRHKRLSALRKPGPPRTASDSSQAPEVVLRRFRQHSRRVAVLHWSAVRDPPPSPRTARPAPTKEDPSRRGNPGPVFGMPRRSPPSFLLRCAVHDPHRTSRHC